MKMKEKSLVTANGFERLLDSMKLPLIYSFMDETELTNEESRLMERVFKARVKGESMSLESFVHSLYQIKQGEFHYPEAANSVQCIIAKLIPRLEEWQNIQMHSDTQNYQSLFNKYYNEQSDK